jgi:hypothetical protein
MKAAIVDRLLRTLFVPKKSHRKFLVAATGLITMLLGLMPATAQWDACMPGYVWRMATPDDHVCATPDTKAQAAKDNAAAARRNLRGDTCIRGYVWRLSKPQDHVCVAQQTRNQIVQDNSMAASRLASTAPTQPIITPSAATRLPPPPPDEEGCHHFEGGQWQNVPCASGELVRQLNLHLPGPPPGPPSGPPFSPGYFINTDPRAPLTWTSVSIHIDSDPTKASEFNSYMDIANMFSIQNNAQPFTCSFCKLNSPFTGSKPNDFVFVQFTDQSRPGQGDFICIWQIDMTANNNYQNKCISTPIVDNSLTGSGATHNQAAQIIGYVQCPTSGSNQNCRLHVIAFLPWLSGQWWETSDTDLFGLGSNGNWIAVAGTILGYSSSTAIFRNVDIVTTVQAYSCLAGLPYPTTVPAPTDNPGGPRFSPTACSNVSNQYQLGYFATPIYNLAGGTFSGENNNLTVGPAQFSCPTSSPTPGGDYCVLWYKSFN